MRLGDGTGLEDADRRRSIILSALLGGSLGDGFGVALSRGSTPFEGRGRARVSEVTQLALCTSEGLLRGVVRFRSGKQPNLANMLRRSLFHWGAVQPGVTLGDVGKEQAQTMAWLQNQPLMQANRRRGRTTKSALELAGPDLPAANHSAGSMVLTRIAPLGLWPKMQDNDLASVVTITHGGASAVLAGTVLLELLAAVRDGAKISTATVGIATNAAEPYGADGERLVSMLKHAVAGDPLPGATGHLADEALALAVSAACRTRDLQEAFRIASEPSGVDTAVVCSLTGTLLATEIAASGYHDYGSIALDAPIADGTQHLPRDWLDRLEGRELVERVAADFTRITSADYVLCSDDIMRYPGV